MPRDEVEEDWTLDRQRQRAEQRSAAWRSRAGLHPPRRDELALRRRRRPCRRVAVAAAGLAVGVAVYDIHREILRRCIAPE